MVWSCEVWYGMVWYGLSWKKIMVLQCTYDLPPALPMTLSCSLAAVVEWVREGVEEASGKCRWPERWPLVDQGGPDLSALPSSLSMTFTVNLLSCPY